MTHHSTVFLKVVIVLIAIGALIGLIRFPQTEGRAANLDLLSIYKDPFIIYAYIASIPFFVSLFYAWKLLDFVANNQAFSQVAITAANKIKSYAMALVALIAAPVAYLAIAFRGKDDIAGGVAGGLFLIFTFLIIAAAATVFQNLLQNGIDSKSKNLTI